MIHAASLTQRAQDHVPAPPVERPPSAHQAHRDGWLGQVPPPAPPSAPQAEEEPSPYAVPWLEPTPWHTGPDRPGVDPTLFG